MRSKYLACVSTCHGKSSTDFARVSACHGKSSEDLARVSTCHGKSSKDFAASYNMKHFLCAFICIYHSLMRWVIYVKNFEFLNVAKFPTLARLIIRYSIRELLQNVNIFTGNVLYDKYLHFVNIFVCPDQPCERRF